VRVIIIIRGELNLDDSVGGEDKGVLSRVEVGLSAGTLEDLQERGLLGREVGDIVDIPDGLASDDLELERDVDIGLTGSFGEQGHKRTLDKTASAVVRTESYRSSGVLLGGTGVAENCAGQCRILCLEM